MGICLDHIQARQSVFAADDEASTFLVLHDEKSVAWKQGFMRWLGTHSQIAIVHGRVAWMKGAEARTAKWKKLDEEVPELAVEGGEEGVGETMPP